MVLRIVEPQLVAKRLDSVADIPPDIRVAADPARLQGIVLTLLSNAIRFTEPGGHVMIDVGYPEGMPEDVVMLRVGDSGCGISTRASGRDLRAVLARGTRPLPTRAASARAS